MSADQPETRCCTAPDCCGPGSYCCANAGDHSHEEGHDPAALAQRVRQLQSAEIVLLRNERDAARADAADLRRRLEAVEALAAYWRERGWTAGADDLRRALSPGTPTEGAE